MFTLSNNIDKWRDIYLQISTQKDGKISKSGEPKLRALGVKLGVERTWRRLGRIQSRVIILLSTLVWG